MLSKKLLLFCSLAAFAAVGAQSPSNVSVVNVATTKYGLMNTEYSVGATVRNLGPNPVTKITMTWNDGSGDNTATINTGGLYVNQQRVFNHPVKLNYSSMVNKTITVTVTEVNDLPDSDPSNNKGTSSFSTISQLSPKKVVIEEGTGTWCGWCPRGMVAMAAMDNEFPDNFIGIAVHAGVSTYPDPMELPAYRQGTGITAFPGMNIDRVKMGAGVSESEMRLNITSRKDIITPAELNAEGNLTGNTLRITPSATFRANITNADLRFAVVLIEDGVKGTTQYYGQRNYYSGGASGPMGGYENLPDPVPAANMVYDHVGRVLLGGYAGQVGSIPANLVDGQVATYAFNTTIPSGFNTAAMKAVVLLLDGTNGEIVNAKSFVLSTLGTTFAETSKNYLTVYPNPTTEYFRVQADYSVDLQIFDTSGRLVMTKTNVPTDQNVSVSNLKKGVYMVHITEKGKGSKTKTQKLIIK